MQRKLVLCCIIFCVAEAIKSPITIRTKRQECKCIPNNAAGGLTCSCSKDDGSHGPMENIQQADLAQELTNNVQIYPQGQGQGQARCGCLQIVFLGNPQYQCQCGDGQGPINPIYTTYPTTTPTTTIPTTTTRRPVDYPNPSGTENPGRCQCVMIQISGPASAQYQCNCDGAQQAYPTLAAETMTTHEPVQETYAPITYAPETPATTEAPMTLAPEQYPQQMPEQIPQQAPQQQLQPATQYPLTTTCVMYVGMQTTPCICLPQYDQCAHNVCCLKAKFRSLKNNSVTQPQNDAEPSTVDMLMSFLQKIKNKLNH
ncbi:unnamed protein product [Cylicocyclus nassatus]|uniref:Uncharacterized protein n=1 Tax=Cylicocyclus nassatus TaxID=53992 RepID=A0AA36MEA8_CYLNA|nr:unnamed protein product [Cylicocyclus nassatus]